MRTFSDNFGHRSRRRRGYGLLEALICLSIMSLLFLGAMTLIISSGRSTVRTQAQVFATGDAANSIQNIIGQIREASVFCLPTSSAAGTPETHWNMMGMTAATLGSDFSTTLNGETINTGIQIVTPPVLLPAADGYSANVPKVRVTSTTGGYWEVTPYNNQLLGDVNASTVLLIYRGDPDTTPDAAAGTYLWQYKIPTTSTFNTALYPPTALCKSVSTAPDAVQFVRPAYGGVAEQSQLEVKIISSYFSPINGQQTSEEGNGASSSQLSGKCVFMRDHYTGDTSATTNYGQGAGNNAFQYH